MLQIGSEQNVWNFFPMVLTGEWEAISANESTPSSKQTKWGGFVHGKPETSHWACPHQVSALKVCQ